MIGVFNNSLPGYDTMSPVDALDAAGRLGLGGVIFSNVLQLSPTLDPAVLSAIAEAASARGIVINAGAGNFNPARPGRAQALIELGNGDIVAGMEKTIRAMPLLGAKTLFFVVGMIEDRDDANVPWAAQLQGVIDGVKALIPAVRESGTRLLIKTHEEITTFEILRIIEEVGSDVLGIAHDPVNVCCRLEDAVEATRRIAPHVAQVHIDDALVTFDGEQMRRYLTPMGTGVIDWRALLALVPNATRWVEFHRGQFAMPVFDKAWLAAQTDANLEEYRALVGAAFKHAHSGDPLPQQTDVFARLTPTIDWLRANG